MRTGGWWFRAVIKEEERGFLYRDGAFVRLLEPGRHTLFDWRRRLGCDVVKVVRTDVPTELAQMFAKTHPKIAAEHFAIVQCGRARWRSSPSTAIQNTLCRQTPRGCSGRR